MFSERGENRRKHWYSLFLIGHKKLCAMGVVLLLLILGTLTVLVIYSYRASQYDLSRVVMGSGESALYDRDNQLISPLSASSLQPVSWEDLPQQLIDAFVAREDESFFEHKGIVYTAVLRSILRNIISMGYEQGASTITMQLTRNVFELHDKTLDRKLLEAALAQKIEEKYDKETILTQYLNRIYYGQNCYGIAAAADHYFGKKTKELNLVECATLAGLVRAPSLCNPQKSMENAMGVKRETLDRMLLLGKITQQERDMAVQAPIGLALAPVRRDAAPTYATMWVNRELDTRAAELGENAGGISVVTYLDLSLQQYVEQAVERALSAVEQPARFPDEWLPLLSDDPATAAAMKKAYMVAKRPPHFKVRGEDNDVSGILQSCVLVLDANMNRKGQVLAVVSGRSAVDDVDRWRTPLKPGRAAAPLLFCCACLPGEDDMHIVARNTEVTGLRLGYDVVRAFYESLKLGIDLPGRDNEKDLYNGLFLMPRLELARLLFCIQNQGRGYNPVLISRIWSRGQKLLYTHEREKAPEYIRRESAVAVSQISPFLATNRQPVTLSESLPEGYGHWTMLSSRNGLAVFVWMGYDDPRTAAATAKELRALLSRASLCLAKEIYAKAREIQQERKKQKK